MNKPRLLGLHGWPRTGKDSLADLFVTHEGYTKLAFGDPLYQEIADAYGVSEADLRSDEWKSKKQHALQYRQSNSPEFMRVAKAAGIYADEHLTSRQVLQLWATEYRRKHYGEDYWVKQMLALLGSHAGRDIVFSDLRHDIEACMGHFLVSRGQYQSMVVVEVLRHSAVSNGHSSDHGLSRFLVDHTIRNNTTIGECFAETKLVLLTGQEGITHG